MKGGNRNLPSGTTNLGKSELDTPDLTLVAQTVLSDELQLGITTFGVEEKNRQYMSVSIFLTIDLSRVKLLLSGR